MVDSVTLGLARRLKSADYLLVWLVRQVWCSNVACCFMAFNVSNVTPPRYLCGGNASRSRKAATRRVLVLRGPPRAECFADNSYHRRHEATAVRPTVYRSDKMVQVYYKQLGLEQHIIIITKLSGPGQNSLLMY